MERAVRRAAGGIAIAMSLYHMWFAASAPPEAMIFRGTHLLFALVLVFLFVPAGGREGPRRLLWLDLCLVALSAVAIGYIFANYQYIVNRIIYIDDLTTWDKVMAAVTVVLVLDATRRVIGWALGRTLEAELALRALRMALDERRPGPGLVHHSDRGVQYASWAYTDLLTQHQAVISMSRKGNPWDNGWCESFMKTLKCEEVNINEYRDWEEVLACIGEFIEVVYNRKRLHSALGYVPPAEFEDGRVQ